MSETGASHERIEAAVLGLFAAWNDPTNHNPRTGRRYKEPWSTRLWYQFMRAALNAAIGPEEAMVRRSDVAAVVAYVQAFTHYLNMVEGAAVSAWDEARTDMHESGHAVTPDVLERLAAVLGEQD